jgi:hypothetical protein
VCRSDPFAIYNPSLENVTVVDAFDFIIDEFGKQGMMVLVDNHVSDPKWCCDNNDGNGFFGDQYFDPKKWLEGLSNVANRVKGKPQVQTKHIFISSIRYKNN